MSPNDASDTRGTILIVEDEEAVRDVLKQALEFAGYEVLQAANGEKALAQLDVCTDRLSLLVLDAQLDGLRTSRDVLQATRARQPRMPVLVVSGDREDVALSSLAQDDGTLPAERSFLQKPFTVAVLEQTVAEILGG